MTNISVRNYRNKERGIALFFALLAVLLLAAIGIGFMFMADTENSVNNNYRDAQKAYFASRAGEESIRLLLAPAGPLAVQALNLGMPTNGNQNNVLYVKNPNASETASQIDPTTGAGATVAANPYLDNELCQEQFAGLGLNHTSGVACLQAAELKSSNNYFTVPVLPLGSVPNSGQANALPFKWVRLTNKQNLMGLLSQTTATKVDPTQPAGAQICWDGTREVAITAGTCQNQPVNMRPVWLLTSLGMLPAVGNISGSRRILQMELALSPPLLPPANITTQAPVTLQGSFSLNAYDNCNCTCNGTTCTGAGCNGTHHAIYTAGTVSVSGNAGNTITSFGSNPAGTASVQNVSPWPYDTNTLITQFKNQAVSAAGPPWNYSCTGTANFSAIPAVYQNCGTQSSQVFGVYPTGLPSNPIGSVPATVYVPGSVKLTSAATGSGVLVVDGDLEINGGLNYYGLLLVRGKVKFTGGAGPSVNLYGAILAGEDVNATDQAQSDTFGGSINFNYDSCALSQQNSTVPPKLLATHEITY
ncbi:MAG TPA: hypothetical protein VNW97_01655 [Candidatus Saccharimonadales bacterium]|jgi:hypothetical protein|nr:hypothetical protein [Candidatus Saccharimonadales bacterium]